jgi:SAM-dependent methyltransferase
MDSNSAVFCCPLDRGELRDFVCVRCGTAFPAVDVSGTKIRDLRAIDRPASMTFDMTVPVPILPDALRKKLLVPRTWPSDLVPQDELRKRYGTKLSIGFQHHVREIVGARGTALAALDLGCGNGGNKRYLADLGVTNVVGIDWWSTGADALADAHRLPFRDASFDLVISTAVLEHCYFPHLVMREIHRVLRPGGSALMGASFWEKWHGESFFHFTPNGIYAVCTQAKLELVDLWSGWGFIPAVLTHAVSRRLRKPGYQIQRVWDRVTARVFGPDEAYHRKIKTSGSLHFRVDRVAVQ